MKRVACILGTVLISGSLLVGCEGEVKDVDNPQFTKEQENEIKANIARMEAEEEALEESYAAQIITLEEYEMIEEGMTYEKVMEITGEEGTMESESLSNTGGNRIYTWTNDDGSDLMIQFDVLEDGETTSLIRISQSGLE